MKCFILHTYLNTSYLEHSIYLFPETNLIPKQTDLFSECQFYCLAYVIWLQVLGVLALWMLTCEDFSQGCHNHLTYKQRSKCQRFFFMLKNINLENITMENRHFFYYSLFIFLPRVYAKRGYCIWNIFWVPTSKKPRDTYICLTNSVWSDFEN